MSLHETTIGFINEGLKQSYLIKNTIDGVFVKLLVWWKNRGCDKIVGFGPQIDRGLMFQATIHMSMDNALDYLANKVNRHVYVKQSYLIKTMIDGVFVIVLV